MFQIYDQFGNFMAVIEIFMVLLCSGQIALHAIVNHVWYLLIILAKAMFRPISQNRIDVFLCSNTCGILDNAICYETELYDPF